MTSFILKKAINILLKPKKDQKMINTNSILLLAFLMISSCNEAMGSDQTLTPSKSYIEAKHKKSLREKHYKDLEENYNSLINDYYKLKGTLAVSVVGLTLFAVFHKDSIKSFFHGNKPVKV